MMDSGAQNVMRDSVMWMEKSKGPRFHYHSVPDFSQVSTISKEHMYKD